MDNIKIEVSGVLVVKGETNIEVAVNKIIKTLNDAGIVLLSDKKIEFTCVG